MAFIDVTRADSFYTKKLLSQLVINIDENTREDSVVDAGNYLVAYLPEGCVVQNAYVFTTSASGGANTVDVGITEGGAEILSGATLDILGESGTFVDKLYTDTGFPVYITTNAGTEATYYIIIEYIELSVNTGSLTRIT